MITMFKLKLSVKTQDRILMAIVVVIVLGIVAALLTEKSEHQRKCAAAWEVAVTSTDTLLIELAECDPPKETG